MTTDYRSLLDDIIAVQNDSPEDVKQYGVTGMKWGVRRDNKQQAKTKEKQDWTSGRSDPSSEYFAKSTAVAAKSRPEINEMIREVNNSDRYRNADFEASADSYTSYLNEVEKRANKIYEKNSREIGRSGATGRYRISMRAIPGRDPRIGNTSGVIDRREQVGKALRVAAPLAAVAARGIYSVAMTHAETEEYEVELKRDVRGFVQSIGDPKKSSISHQMFEHYGVMGMKWGVRKTSDGRRVGTPVAGTAKAKRTTASVQPSSKPKKKKPRDMSDEELRDSISRLKLEKELKSLTASERQRGRSAMSSVLSASGETALKAVATAAMTYALTVAINKATSGKVNATAEKGKVDISSVLDKKKD